MAAEEEDTSAHRLRPRAAGQPNAAAGVATAGGGRRGGGGIQGGADRGGVVRGSGGRGGRGGGAAGDQPQLDGERFVHHFW